MAATAADFAEADVDDDMLLEGGETILPDPAKDRDGAAKSFEFVIGLLGVLLLFVLTIWGGVTMFYSHSGERTYAVWFAVPYLYVHAAAAVMGILMSRRWNYSKFTSGFTVILYLVAILTDLLCALVYWIIWWMCVVKESGLSGASEVVCKEDTNELWFMWAMTLGMLILAIGGSIAHGYDLVGATRIMRNRRRKRPKPIAGLKKKIAEIQAGIAEKGGIMSLVWKGSTGTMRYVRMVTMISRFLAVLCNVTSILVLTIMLFWSAVDSGFVFSKFKTQPGWFGSPLYLFAAAANSMGVLVILGGALGSNEGKRKRGATTHLIVLVINAIMHILSGFFLCIMAFIGYLRLTVLCDTSGVTLFGVDALVCGSSGSSARTLLYAMMAFSSILLLCGLCAALGHVIVLLEYLAGTSLANIWESFIKGVAKQGKRFRKADLGVGAAAAAVDMLADAVLPTKNRLRRVR